MRCLSAFFEETFPFGRATVDLIEEYNLDSLGVGHGATGPISPTREKQLREAREKAEEAAKAAKAYKDSAEEKAKQGLQNASEKVTEAAQSAKDALVKKEEEVRQQLGASKASAPQPETSKQQQAKRPVGKELDATPQPMPDPIGKPYDGPPLPLGFEPPPGYYIPRPKQKDDAAPASGDKAGAYPLVASSVNALSLSEPSLGHLASTIDALAAFLKDNPATANEAGGVKKVLSSAESDLKSLGQRLESIKDAEKSKLEQSLSDQSKQYASQLAQNEKDLLQRLQSKEQDWQKSFESEREQMIAAYRSKLNSELDAQKELINERLKEELIAQGIELQRRWMKDIKMRVEEERGGRLAKLEDLSENVKKLEEATKQNSTYLDESLQVNKLWSALQAAAASDGQGAVLADSVRALRELSKEDEVIQTALSTVAPSTLADGVAPFADLASWFSLKVAPRIKTAALMPDANAGCVAYWTSYILSPMLFAKQGWSEGEDVMSVLGRAEYSLSRKDLDGAARQINQLTVRLFPLV